MPSASCSNVIRRSATACSRASASSRSPSGCCTTTSAGTAAGYPNGLAGEAIPIGARVIFVADAFDAMTSNRLYRPALSHAEALAEVERCSGTQFDPDVVAAFLAVIGAREPAVA